MFLLALTDYIPLAITFVVIVVGYKFLFGNKQNEEKKIPIKKDNSSENTTQINSNDEFQVEANVDEINNGEMKEVKVGELGSILLVKEKGEIHAIGNKCSHSSAPLKNGALCNGRIRCPWHGACFSVTTGDIEDFPGLDSIQTFPVKIEGKKAIIKGKNTQLTEWKRSGKSGRCDKNNQDVIAIVGAGPSSLTCAETLRSEGYTGRIVFIGKEKYLPYDRTKLSKSLSTTGEKARLRDEAWFKNNDIELILGNGAKELNPEEKRIVLENGQEITYNKAFVATGGNPRRIPVENLDKMKNLFFLRVPEDAQGIASKSEGANIVIVGSSFIGMEVASIIASKAKSISIIGMEKVPFERVLGVKIGQAMKEWHEFKSEGKITWYMEAVVSEISTHDDFAVKEVVLKSGTRIPCDVVVVGAGVVPATEFIKQTGLVKLERDQAVLVDRFMHAGNDLYCGGDIARYQFHLTGDSVRIEHYGMAQFHGKIAALNMLGKKTECLNIPFFWTTQYSKSLRYCGHALHYDDVVIDGNLSSKDFKFVGYFCQGNKVIAAVSMDRDPAVAIVAELLQNNQMITKEELLEQLKKGSVTFLGKL